MEVICGYHVANSILEKSFEEENYITLLKLNCLVYLLYSEYLYLNGDAFDECLSHVWEKFKNIDDLTTLSYIESGRGYFRKEDGEILTECDMLMDEISRKEEELEKAKIYFKRFNKQ